MRCAVPHAVYHGLVARIKQHKHSCAVGLHCAQCCQAPIRTLGAWGVVEHATACRCVRSSICHRAHDRTLGRQVASEMCQEVIGRLHGHATAVGRVGCCLQRCVAARRVAVAAMLLVAADAHLWTPATTAGDGDPWPASRDGKAWSPRLGMSSSVDRRGWSRSTDMRDDKTAERARLWSAIVGCGGGVVDASERLITPTGDLNWWTYRRTLAVLNGDAVSAVWRGEPGAGERPPQIWVGSGSPGPDSRSGPPGGWHTLTSGEWRLATPRPCARPDDG